MLEDFHQVGQALVFLVESRNVLFERLVLLGLHLVQLLLLLHLLHQLCVLLLKVRQLLILLLHGGLVSLQASIILLDHLLQLFVGELVHGVQTEGDLLRRRLLTVVLRRTLIADGVTDVWRAVLLLELGIQLFLPLVQHACSGTPLQINFINK